MIGKRIRLLLLVGGLSAVASFLIMVIVPLVLDGHVSIMRAISTSLLLALLVSLLYGYQLFKHHFSTPAKIDVLLVRVPSSIASGPDCGESLALGYLAKYLQKSGYKVEIVDARLLKFDPSRTIDLILSFKCKVIGFSVPFQRWMKLTSEIIQQLRLLGVKAHITIGGLYPSMAAENLLSNIPGIDSVIRFEGEQTLLELVQNIDRPEKWSEINGLIFRSTEGTITTNQPRSLIEPLDSLPYPSRVNSDLVKKAKGFNYVLSSRGCFGGCSYCVQPSIKSIAKGPNWRGRDPVLVVDEVKQCLALSGNKLFSFVDDDFTGMKKNGKYHAELIAQELISQKIVIEYLISIQPIVVEKELFTLLKESGLRSVILAADNFSQPVLDRYNKCMSVTQVKKSINILHELNIDAYIGLILFDPWTSLPELKENLLVLRDIPFYRPWQITSYLEVIAGTAIEKSLHENGKLISKDNFMFDYEFENTGVEQVFSTFHQILKYCGFCLKDVDKFRWGSPERRAVEETILERFPNEFQVIEKRLNKEISDVALQVVEHQIAANGNLLSSELLDKNLIHYLQSIDKRVITEIASLRKLNKKVEGI